MQFRLWHLLATMGAIPIACGTLWHTTDGRRYPRSTEYSRVGHSLFDLLLAMLGGTLGAQIRFACSVPLCLCVRNNAAVWHINSRPVRATIIM